MFTVNKYNYHSIANGIGGFCDVKNPHFLRENVEMCNIHVQNVAIGNFQSVRYIRMCMKSSTHIPSYNVLILL